MTQANAEITASTFFPALGAWYGTTQATSIRRQLDKDSRSISFHNLLTAIAANPDVMTRARHVALWKGGDETDELAKELWDREANENFDRFAGAGNDVISPDRTEADVAALWAIAEPVVIFVNKAVAHTDEDARDSVSTYGELHRAIDALGDLLNKYSSLLTATIIGELVPVHQEDWRHAFRVAWLRDA